MPSGPAGDEVVETAAAALRAAVVVPLLDEGIRASYVEGTRRLREVPRATLLAEGDRPAGVGFQVGPMFTMSDADAVSDVVFDECFGSRLP